MKCTALLVFLLHAFLCAAEASEPKNHAEAMAQYLEAITAFGVDDHQRALDLLEPVEKFLALHPAGIRNFDHHYREFSLIDLIREHQQLRQLQPGSIMFMHRVQVFYIKHIDTEFMGQKIAGDFNAAMRAAAQTSQAVCAKYVEVLSGGKLSLSFDVRELDCTVIRLTGESFIQADTNSLLPYPGPEIFTATKSHDTIMFFYPDGGAKLANGASFTAMGGLGQFPIFPGFIAGPKRGWMVISATLLNRPGTLFHELFHVMENFYGIKPAHGYADGNRSRFPDWTGKGEFDYYRYQFRNIVDSTVLPRFDLLKAYPQNMDDKLIAPTFRAASALTPSQRQRYQDLRTLEAAVGNKQDPIRGRYFDEMIQLFPYDYDVFLRAGIYHHFYGDKQKSFSLINQAYQLNPRHAEVCYFMGVAYYHQGKYAESAAYLGEGIALSDQPSSFYVYRSNSWYQAKNYAAAKADYLYMARHFPDLKDWLISTIEGRLGNASADLSQTLSEVKSIMEVH